MRDRGFTLIELIIVIVLLGILGVTALPRFINLSDDAHIAIIKGTKGNMESAISMLHSKAKIEGQPTSIELNGYTLSLTTDGWPYSADGTHQGCVDIWNATIDSSQSMVIWTGADFVAQEWSAFNYLSTCLYYYQNGTVRDSTTPGLQYWHINHPDPSYGIVAGDIVSFNVE